MRSLNRGFTLVEVLVAVTLLGVIAAVGYPIVTANQRLYRSQTRRIDGRQNLRAAVSVLPAEFRALDARDGDILAMSPTSITLRGMRQLAVTCTAPGTGIATSFVVREQPFFGARDLNPDTDSLLIYYEDSLAHDAWMPARLVSIGAGTCADGAPGRLLSVRLASGAVRLESGAPVRGFEIVTYRLYKGGDGQWQIGVLDAQASAIQPLVGPVTAAGLELFYRDSAGAVTAVPQQVATIEMRVRTNNDSAASVVALRNNGRP